MSLRIISKSFTNVEFELKSDTKFTILRGLINALRRVSLSEIKTFAFDKVEIYKNTSNVNNTDIADDLGLFPIRHELKEGDELVLKISLKNNTYLKTFVSPDEHFKFFLNNKPIQLKYGKARIWCLKHDQEIRLTAEIKLDNAKTHAKYCDTIPGKYKEVNSNHFNMSIISGGRLGSKKIILKSLQIIRNKIDKFINIYNEEKHDEINIFEEDSTLGEIICMYLLEHPDIEIATYKYIKNTNNLRFLIKDKGNNVIKQCAYIINLITHLEKEFEKNL